MHHHPPAAQSPMVARSPGAAGVCSPCGLAVPKGGAKVKPIRPCRVCGQIFQDMPRNSRECFIHTKDAASCQRYLESQVSEYPKDKTKRRDLEDFKRMRKEADEPPSKYSTTVLEFAQNNPSVGQGRSRANYNVKRQLEETSATQQTRKGTRTVMMWKERFLLWGKGVGLPHQTIWKICGRG